MITSNFTTTILVEETPKKVFEAINNVRGWWTENFDGSSQKVNDIFTVHFGETFITIKIEELIPGKKIVWYVTDCNKHWLKNKKEWKGTEIIWEISSKNETTQIDFTHRGLVPKLECYNVCENAWCGFLIDNIFNAIKNGKAAA
jgi:hypothetical protein